MQHPDLDNLDVLVIGAGLFGQIIGRHLMRQGRTVMILDAEKPKAASKAAACIMKPSWLASSFTKKEQAQAMATLDANYGVHEIDAFVSAPGPIRSLGKRTSVHWVAPGSIFKPNSYRVATVVDVSHGGPRGQRKPLFKLGIEEPWRSANLIIVAAGVWSNALPSLPSVVGLAERAGVAFLWDCDPNRESRVSIQPYQPYRQILMLPNVRPGKLWLGDGTSLKESSLTERRIEISRDRCAQFANTRNEPNEQIIGLRPYVKGLKAPCYLKETLPNVWTVNGGAKNGTAAAGWAAYKIAEATN